MCEQGHPAPSGYKMPAEWQKHACTYLAWPHNRDTWPYDLADAQKEFLNLVQTIAEDERVIVFVPDSKQQDLFLAGVEKKCATEFPIESRMIPTNDAWIRDYGPTYVVNQKQLLAIDWQYNAWGGKYPPFVDDQQFVVRLLEEDDTTGYFKSNLCIEGGAIEVDGNGLGICTKSCALDPNRNLGWSLNRIENEMKARLGLETIIWLDGAGIIGDDTDGHIDQLARFSPGKHLLHAWTSDTQDPQYIHLQKNLVTLRNSLEKTGGAWELTSLPLPTGIRYRDQQLPASYCNFFITNQSVLVPQFGDRVADDQALQTMDEVFPERSVIGLPSFYLSCGLGSFHCLTQQEPAVQDIGNQCSSS